MRLEELLPAGGLREAQPDGAHGMDSQAGYSSNEAYRYSAADLKSFGRFSHMNYIQLQGVVWVLVS